RWSMPGTPELDYYHERGDIDYCPVHRCEYNILTGEVELDCPLHRAESRKRRRARFGRIGIFLDDPEPSERARTPEEEFRAIQRPDARLSAIGSVLLIAVFLVALYLAVVMSLENARLSAYVHSLPGAGQGS